MYDERTWFIGTSVGELFYTLDEGDSWTELTLPVTVLEINEIEFHDEAIGYIVVQIGAATGTMMRTTDGGASWYVMPKKIGDIPDNDRLNSVAVCADPNIVWAAGLGDNGTDGIILKAA